jgi:hypothetical protein
MWNQKIRRIAPDKVLSFSLPGFWLVPWHWVRGLSAVLGHCANERLGNKPVTPAFAGIRALHKSIAIVV